MGNRDMGQDPKSYFGHGKKALIEFQFKIVFLQVMPFTFGETYVLFGETNQK